MSKSDLIKAEFTLFNSEISKVFKGKELIVISQRVEKESPERYGKFVRPE